jgi:hypothetical protein
MCLEPKMSEEILISFLKQQSVSLSYNAIGIRLFNIKLKQFLKDKGDNCEKWDKGDNCEKWDKGDKGEKCDEMIIEAIINYSNNKTILQAFKLFKDDRLLTAALSCFPYKLCLPQERWSPENFMIKVSDDHDPDPKILHEMEKKNEVETIWLKSRLLTGLHPNCSFSLKKPMVFYIPKRTDDCLFNECDSEIFQEIIEESEKYQIRRVLLVVVNKINLFQTEKLVRLRMSKNVQIRLCFIITGTGQDLHTEYIEWLSSKLEIPLIKFDLTPINIDIVCDNHTDLINKLLQNELDNRFNDELLWNYGIPEADENIDKLQFMPIEVLKEDLEDDLEDDLKDDMKDDMKDDLEDDKEDRNIVIDFLNKRNIPFLAT